MMPTSDQRRWLLELYAAALARVGGRASVRGFLSAGEREPCRVVAIGKAAAAMALGAFDALGEWVEQALVITRHGYGDALPADRVTLMEAGHPLPDAQSLEAGAALLRFIDAAPPGQRMLFLLSGGASALVERLPDGVNLDDLARANRWLLGSGLPIAAMNRVRKRLSLIKQGRLAERLADRPVLCLLISDVPGDAPAVIGSGPLVADPEGSMPLPPLPPWLEALAARAPAAPAADDPCFARIETHVIASNRDARLAVVEAAQLRVPCVHPLEGLLTGEVDDAAKVVSGTLLDGEPGLYVWGGEPTVRLPPEPGRGGRCQQLALRIALGIAGRDDILVLAGGTDGSDGPGEDAGALVDGATVARGEAEGFDPREALARADAGTFLEASGDLIATGPTGTNVMDLIIGVKRSPS